MATPICALAAAVSRSAAAMSGLRSSSCEGTPTGTLGRARSSGEGGMLKVGQIDGGDGSDGVLKLRARHADIHQLGVHGFKLRLRLGTSAWVATPPARRRRVRSSCPSRS